VGRRSVNQERERKKKRLVTNYSIPSFLSLFFCYRPYVALFGNLIKTICITLHYAFWLHLNSLHLSLTIILISPNRFSSPSLYICRLNSFPKLWQSNPNYPISLWSISSLLSISLRLNSRTDIFFDFMYFLFNMEIKWNSMHAWDTLLFVLVSSCLFSVPDVFVLEFTLCVLSSSLPFFAC